MRRWFSRHWVTVLVVYFVFTAALGAGAAWLGVRALSFRPAVLGETYGDWSQIDPGFGYDFEEDYEEFAPYGGYDYGYGYGEDYGNYGDYDYGFDEGYHYGYDDGYANGYKDGYARGQIEAFGGSDRTGM